MPCNEAAAKFSGKQKNQGGKKQFTSLGAFG
jgi:hypothetical protein